MMNEVEAYQVCNSAISALSHGETNLSIFPKLLRRIITEEAWKSRKVPGKGMVAMKSLRELVTTPPITGWGEDPAKIEALIRDDAEVLAMWREAMKNQGKRNDLCSNPTEVKADRGKAYTVSRLQREAPELFAQVAAGTISANAAAIKAGFRRRKTPLDQLNAAWSKAREEERHQFLDMAVCENEEEAFNFTKWLDAFCVDWASNEDGEVDQGNYLTISVQIHSLLQKLHESGVSFLWPDWKTTGRGKEGLSHYLQLAHDEVELGDPDEVAKQIKYKRSGDYAQRLMLAIQDELKKSSTEEAA